MQNGSVVNGATVQSIATEVRPMSEHSSARAEEAVLGAMLLDNSVIPKVTAIINETDFYCQKNRHIFSIIRAFYESGHTADQVTVCDAIAKAGKLDDVGGAAYIAGLVGDTATAANVEAHAEIVKRHAIDRRIMSVSEQIQTDALVQDLEPARYIPVLEDLEKERAGRRVRRKKLSEGLDVPEREWLIQDWLPANEVTVFTGQGGIGKSRLALQIAGKIATGWPGSAWQTRESRPDAAEGSYSEYAQKVLITSWEDDLDEIKRRVIDQQEGVGFMPYDLVRENIEIASMRGEGPIWGVGVGENINNRARLLPAGKDVLFHAEDFGASLLVLDPSAAAFGGNENDRAAVRQYLSHLSRWAADHNCAVLILQHPPKYTNANYSGSTDWEGSARAMWKFERVKDEEKIYHLHVTKSNYLKSWPQEVYLEIGKGGAWRECDYTPPQPITDEDIEEQIIEYLTNNPNQSKTEIKKHISGRNDRKVDAINNLSRSGRIDFEKQGRKEVYFLT